MYTRVLNAEGAPYMVDNGYLYYRDRGNCSLESCSIPAHYLLSFSDATMRLKMLWSMVKYSLVFSMQFAGLNMQDNVNLNVP